MKHTGSCLCGAVTYHAQNPVVETSACHCEMCRRWAGGPFFGTAAVENVVFSGEEHIAHYRSSDWAERAFCKKCGSGLYFRMVDSGHLFLATGTLDDPSAIKLVREVFIDEKPEYYSFSSGAKKMTGKEMFAMYAPPEKT